MACKEKRYFYFLVDTPTYDVSGYVSGADTLLEVISNFTKEFGYGIEFNIIEVSKEVFENAERNER